MEETKLEDSEKSKRYSRKITAPGCTTSMDPKYIKDIIAMARRESMRFGVPLDNTKVTKQYNDDL